MLREQFYEAFVSKDSGGDSLTVATLLCEIDKEQRKDLSTSLADAQQVPLRKAPAAASIACLKNKFLHTDLHAVFLMDVQRTARREHHATRGGKSSYGEQAEEAGRR